MRFLTKRRKGNSLVRRIHEEDPMSGVANLFDAAMVFAVGLMIAIVSAYHLSEIFSAEELTMIKNPNQPAKMEIITKKGKEIKVKKVTNRKVGGDEGMRLGTAYQLKDGRVIYIPDELVGEVVNEIE